MPVWVNVQGASKITASIIKFADAVLIKVECGDGCEEIIIDAAAGTNAHDLVDQLRASLDACAGPSTD